MTPDQLPASFRINMKDPEKYEIISETFSSQAGVETVSDQRQVLERLFSWMNGASVAAVGVAGVMIFCAVLLITTTIRLSAFSRRRETGIMRLVGASKMVIQLPFILEGVIAAVMGAPWPPSRSGSWRTSGSTGDLSRQFLTYAVYLFHSESW